MTPNLSSRELDLITTLTSRVRIMATSQVRLLWEVTEASRRTYERRLSRLTAFGLLERHTINAHLLTPDQPLCAWKPGNPDPDAERVSRAAKARWRFAALPTKVCTPTALAANLHGSTACGLPKPEHRDHDLLLSAVYLHFRTNRARLAELWTGEHVLDKAGYRVKDPDAFLRDANGRVLCVLESSGSYSVKQIESFHEHCVEQELPYQLW